MPTAEPIIIEHGAGGTPEIDHVVVASVPAAVVEPREAALSAPAAELARLLQAGAKRAFDIAVSAAILLVTLPLVLLVGLLVRLDSPGPVFYRAQRVGRGGRPL